LWRAGHTIGFLILFGLIAIAGLTIRSPLQAWVAVMVLSTALVVVAGHGITGLWRGFLLDSRRKLSLSRFQLVIWSILVLAAFLTAALANISSRQEDPLGIAVPESIWILLGISVTSLVGSPVLRAPKKNRNRNEDQLDKNKEVAAKQNLPEAEDPKTQGQIIVNDDPRNSSFGDMVRGEEVGNFITLDLGKLQMLYFTAILVLAYGFALGAVLAAAVHGEKITAFPEVAPGMLALLGISHAGYLAYKAAPHSQDST
jgi:hypothetical protein